MTNPTPHGQVPEALIDLIDEYAETRHRCGGIYNAKTEAARNAVIEALSGVQALSAAPEAFLKSVIALCSHRGYSPANIEAWDKDDKWIADLWRQAESMLTTSPTPPALSAAPAPAIGNELRDTLVAVSAAIAERDDRAAQKMIGEILAASPTPPAEQQAAQVIIDFSRVGTAGPFPVANGRVSLPDATMQDLARMLRPTYEAEQQAAPKAAPQQEAQEPAAVVVPCHTPSGKRVALYSAKQDLPIGTQLYTAPQPSPTTKPAPQPAPAPLSEREAFEAWIEKDGGDLGTFGTPPNMHYRNSSVNNAWVAWKARAALAAQGGKT